MFTISYEITRPDGPPVGLTAKHHAIQAAKVRRTNKRASVVPPMALSWLYMYNHRGNPAHEVQKLCKHKAQADRNLSRNAAQDAQRRAGHAITSKQIATLEALQVAALHAAQTTKDETVTEGKQNASTA